MGTGRYLCTGLVMILSVVSGSGEAAETSLDMAPVSKWIVDYADDSCALRRAFEGGEHRVLLELRQYTPGNALEVYVASPTLDARNVMVEAHFEPGEPRTGPLQRSFAFRFKSEAGDAIVYRGSLRREAPDPSEDPTEWPEAERDAREREITALAVDEGFNRPFVLRTGAMHQAMNAMRTCLDELLGHWGLDAEVQRTLSRPVRPVDQADWAKKIQQAYPQRYLRTGRSGFVNVRMIVGPGGEAVSCISNQDSPDRAFDEVACTNLMRHARFEPALDANGEPTTSYWSTTVIYRVN